jgi:hypothetical protein
MVNAVAVTIVAQGVTVAAPALAPVFAVMFAVGHILQGLLNGGGDNPVVATHQRANELAVIFHIEHDWRATCGRRSRPHHIEQ